MCGIVGIVGRSSVNVDLYEALTVLQHRGQDAAGITTCSGQRTHSRKAKGLVRNIFYKRHMKRLKGNFGIGHVRYPTAGTSSASESQPFYTSAPYGISLVHNGTLTNAEQLTQEVFEQDLRHVNTTSDSEVLLHVFANELSHAGDTRFTVQSALNAVAATHRRLEGAYAVVALIAGHGVLAFRDPHGIRPLIFGKRECDGGTEWMFASESVALDIAGFEPVRDVAPGEAIFVTKEGEFFAADCRTGQPLHSPCIFEYVYLARPDSKIDEISVYKSRIRMGNRLAAKIKREWPDHDIDVVIPVPDSSRTAALRLALTLHLKYREGLVKNRYVGRTFIMPGQEEREKSVRRKLNAISLEFKGKNVLLVDDSIVRGTTSRQIVAMARDAGARKVYFASAAPPIRHQNVYGIDMPERTELIAYNRTVEEIAESIGADKLIFQDLEDLIASCSEGNPQVPRFDTSVFDGDYVTGNISGAYLSALEVKRGEDARKNADDDDDDDDGDGDSALN